MNLENEKMDLLKKNLEDEKMDFQSFLRKKNFFDWNIINLSK